MQQCVERADEQLGHDAQRPAADLARVSVSVRVRVRVRLNLSRTLA